VGEKVTGRSDCGHYLLCGVQEYREDLLSAGVKDRLGDEASQPLGFPSLGCGMPQEWAGVGRSKTKARLNVPAASSSIGAGNWSALWLRSVRGDGGHWVSLASVT
jgi:hypothetical protein